MKRVLSLVLVAVLCATMMTACSVRPKDEPQAVPGIYTNKQVPELTIAPLGESAGVEVRIVQPSNYSWSWPKGNGEAESVEACGIGPTDPALLNYIDPIQLGEPVTAKLIWANFQAHSVSVVSWEIGVFDLPADADLSQQNDYLRDTELAEDDDLERTLVLEPNRVYDIYAYWQEVNGSAYGNAHYYVVTKAAEALKEKDPELVGGWQASESPEVTETEQDVFTKATEKLVGVSYEPIAYLGSQVVAGKNHTFLCKAQVVTPNAIPYYALVYIYEDLSGEAEITDIAVMTPSGEIVTTPMPQLVGSWSIPESNENGFAAFEKAAETLTGASYTPTHVLGEQIVAGMNYSVLCQSVVVYPGAKPSYTIAFVYEDLEGKAQITKFIDLDSSGRPIADETPEGTPAGEKPRRQPDAPEYITVNGERYDLLRMEEPDVGHCGNMDGVSAEGYDWQVGPEEGTVYICFEGCWFIYSIVRD